jgi:Flp pilus assembly protein TadG
MIAPPFLFLLMALFQIGLVFMANIVMENAMAEASRTIRTGQAQKGNFTQEQFRQRFCDALVGVIACDSNLLIDVQALPNFGAVSLSWPIDPDGSWTAPGGYSPGTGSEVVVVRAFYQYRVWLPFVGATLANLPNGRRLLASAAAFRNEPF